MSNEQLLLKKFIENNNEYFDIHLTPAEILELTQKLLSPNLKNMNIEYTGTPRSPATSIQTASFMSGLPGGMTVLQSSNQTRNNANSGTSKSP
jgi:hypothetical protein